MRILVLGLNYAPEMISTGIYTGGLCQALAANGHEVAVVAAKPYYPQWQVIPEFRGGGARRSTEAGVDVTRVPIYVPKIPTGPRRLLHYASFAASAAIPLLHSAWSMKPDVVIAIAPSLVAAPLAWLAARLTKARCWLHVQDFEVEAAFATGFLNERGVAGRLGRTFQSIAFRLFDGVSSISAEMCRKLADFGVPPERIYQLRNWADLDRVKPLGRPSRYREEWDIRTPHIALYSGNIAKKQGMELVAAAAAMLRHRDDLTFVICGEGPGLAELRQLAAGLPNVRFRGLQPVERLEELVGLATVHLLPQKAGAADLVLPSKLTNMLASGRPVVATAAQGTGLAREVEGCGIVTPPGDAAAFAAAIEKLIDDPDLHARLSMAARARAVQAWSKERIIPAFEERLLALAK